MEATEEVEVIEPERSQSHKKTVRADEDKRLMMNRLSRIEGQVRGMKRMLDNDAYCPDILIQSAAVQAALKAFSKVVLDNHLRVCVKDELRGGNDEVIDELVHAVYKLV